ncbi:hypothetical protein F383_34516 [Gossypium arboreum]|uniref:Uncharacterized protein n=1 Tax=Gossypium arboreum TaxID=29729 RepID=A0A0B0N4F6_GOSAR|nr:hypothetical protein F383_34516 [Gossypium arboreum]
MGQNSKHDSQERVPAEPKLSPIRKRPILKASRHSKAYKYTLEEENKLHGRVNLAGSNTA